MEGKCHRQVQRMRHTYVWLTVGTVLTKWYRGCPASRNVGSLEGDWLIRRVPVFPVTQRYMLMHPLFSAECILACKATSSTDLESREDLGLRSSTAPQHELLDEGPAHMLYYQEKPFNFGLNIIALLWFSDFLRPGQELFSGPINCCTTSTVGPRDPYVSDSPQPEEEIFLG